MDKNIALASYLYGQSERTSLTEVWDSRRKVYLPVQSSPLKEYVLDVNRFLFSGGINTHLEGLPEDHYSRVIIKTLSEKYLQPNLFSLWETLALTGEVFVLIREKDGVFNFEFFDKREIKPTYTKGKLTWVDIRTIVEIDGKRYIYKLSVNAFSIIEYPLVLEEKETNYDWEKSKEINNHGFNGLPGLIIALNKRLTSERGYGEFNWGSLQLAKSIVCIEYGLDENLYFFGNPLIDSPDPDRTTKDLNAKKQVLQKLPPDEGGEHKLIQPVPLTESELNWLKIKKESFKRSMGVTNTQETRLNDASGVALRIMNDGLISRAQSKWQEIVTYGLEKLLNYVLELASSKGIISLGSLGSLSGKKLITITRSQPYFAMTEQEKIQTLEVANRLIELGVDRAMALQETFFAHKSLEEIEKMLRPNLEDM